MKEKTSVVSSMQLRPISPGLESASLRHLVKLLRDFKEQHESLSGDEIARFTFLCESLFTTFTSLNRSRIGEEDFDWLPAGGNFDTGDSAFPPPREAMDVFGDRRVVEEEMARYIGPETDAALVEALSRFLSAHKFDLARRLEHLGTTVACGTVNLFDAACRDLLQQPGDTVLMPSVGYGFFLAQPWRAGGRVEVVECDSEGRVRPADLARHLSACDGRLYEAWWPGRRHHVYTALRTAERRGLVRLPADEVGVEAVVDALVRGLGRDPDLGRDVLRERVLALDPAADGLIGSRSVDPRRDLAQMVRPPRVRAWLHINPGVTGCLYPEREIAEMGAVLADRDVAAIEDLAYHSIRADGASIYSLQGRLPRCYTLFGLSKPFGLANLRIGLMLVAREDVKRIERLIENTVGFVPLVAQRTAAAALSADGDEARTYLDHASNNTQDSYQTRLGMMLVMLRGASPASPQGYGPTEVEVRRMALEMLAARRTAGIDATGDPALDEQLVETFLAEGLSRWFTLPFTPEAGFFVVVSCQPLLKSGLLETIGIERPGAFDVFAYLAYALGVRTIPEEGMRTAHAQTHLLRMAFSPAPRVLVEGLFTTYLSLCFLEQCRSMEVMA